MTRLSGRRRTDGKAVQQDTHLAYARRQTWEAAFSGSIKFGTSVQYWGFYFIINEDVMFEYIQGSLTIEESEWVVVENGAFGYRIHISRTTMTTLPAVGQDVRLWLHPVFREDDVILFGFANLDEREMFRTLIGISGVGPKVAMGVLSQFSGEELIRHILNNDAKAIAKAPGIGKKTAERILLELKDKYKNVSMPEDTELIGGAVEKIRLTDHLFNEAVNGLMNLGFPYTEASARVEKVIRPELSIEALLQAALSVTLQ